MDKQTEKKPENSGFQCVHSLFFLAVGANTVEIQPVESGDIAVSPRHFILQLLDLRIYNLNIPPAFFTNEMIMV